MIPTRRHVRLAALFAFASGVVMFAACGSDDPAVVSIPDAGLDGAFSDAPSGSDTGSEGDAGSDTGSVSDAATNPDAPGDNVDAAMREDAAKIEAGAPCPGVDSCDCDNDGYRSPACDGGDCDDRDGLRHPNQTYVSEPPDPASNGNWDCKDPIEKQYAINLNCASLLGLSCPAAEGFIDDPGCGVLADYYQCQKAALACNAVKIGTRRQGCK